MTNSPGDVDATPERQPHTRRERASNCARGAIFMRVHFARVGQRAYFVARVGGRDEERNEFMNERGIFSPQPTLRRFSTRIVRKAADATLEKGFTPSREKESADLSFCFYRRECTQSS